MSKTRDFTLSRKVYEKVRKMDHNQMTQWAQSIYAQGKAASNATCPIVGMEDVRTALSPLDGMSEKRLNEIVEVLERLFTN